MHLMLFVIIGNFLKMCSNRINEISEELIKVAGESYVNSGQLVSEVLHPLYLTHGKTLQLALDLIDNKKISILKSSSGRWVYQVIGGSGSYYTILPNSFYCQCPAFKFSVLKKKDSIMCKHVLAAKLATSMQVTNNKHISDQDITDILMDV